VKGIGEPPVIGIAAAVAGAVDHATGVRIRQLPITGERMLRGLLNPKDSGP
jgi:CO/xanthine dehydrogenase Mo-binding subunit